VVHVHGWIAALAPLYIKRAFADDPCFRSAKVVYSVYDNAFDQPFRPSFKQKLLIDGVTEDDLMDLQGDIDFNALTTLAIRYSDGVVQGSEHVDPYLVEQAEALGKPFLAFQNSDCYIDSYNDFYDQICG
jgi:starch synthase